MPNFIPPSLLPGNNPIFLNTTIGIDTEPAKIAASENPVSWLFNTLVIGTDQNALLRVEVTNPPLNGEIFRIESTLAAFPAVEVAGAAVPSLGEYDNTGTLAEIADSIANALNEDIVFSRIFFADSFSAPGSVLVKAINPGRLFNMTFAGGPNFTVTGNSLGGDCCFGQSVKDFSLFVDVYACGAGKFGDEIAKNSMRLITRIQKNYQKENLIKFDVSGILKDFVSTGQPLNGLFNFYPDALKNYCLLFGFVAKNDNNVNERVTTGITGVKWVKNGAFNLLETNDLRDYNCQVGRSDKKFLNTSPDCKEYYLGQKDYINWIWEKKTGSSNIALLYLTPTFYNGSIGPEELVLLLAQTGDQVGVELSALPLGSIETAAGMKIKSFELVLRGSDVLPLAGGEPDISEKKKYVINRECPERFTDLVFLESLGGFGGLRFTKRLDQPFSRETTEFDKTPPFIPAESDIVRGVKETSVQCSERWASGWLPESYHEYLKELIASPSVWQVTETGFKYVIIENARIEFDDEADKYNLIIEFSPTVQENAVSL